MTPKDSSSGEKRAFITKISQALLLGLWMPLACKLQRKAVQRSTAPLNPENEGENPKDSLPIDEPLAQGCLATTSTIKWNNLPKAGEHLECQQRFLGKENSAMMILNFPKYQHGNLRQIFLLRENGEPVAQKSIVESSDVTPQKTLRPIIFDGLFLKKASPLVLIFKTICENCSEDFESSQQVIPGVTFEEIYRGLPVISMSDKTLSKQAIRHQAEARFAPIEGSLEGLYPSGGFTFANKEAVFSPSSLLAGYILTDLSGRTLTQDGSLFNNIWDYPEFFAYRKEGNQYIRTLMRVI